MENKVSGQTATIDVGLKSLLPRNALERNGVDKFVTSRIGDEGRQMSAAKREEAAELDPVGAYFRNAQQRDSFRKSRIRSDVVRDIGGMDTDQTAYYLDVGRRGKHALPTKGLYNETIYFNALDAAGKSENDLGQFSDWIWREKKTIDNVLHGDKTRLEMFFYPEGEEQEDKEQEDDQGTGTETETEVLDHGGEGVLNARRGASSADKDVAAAAKGNHETSSTKSRKLSTRVRSEEAPERERLLPREDEDENKFEDPIDKIKKSELALVSRRPKKERLLPPPSDHEEDEEVVEEAVSPVAGGALDKLIADLRDRADRVGDGKDSQVEDSDIFPPPRPTTTSSSGTMKQNRIQQIEADLLGEGSVEYPFMPMDGGSSSQASSKTSTSSKNTSDLSNSSSSSSTSVDVAADDSSSRTSLVPELEDKKSVFKRSAPAIIDDILAKKKRSSTPVSLAQAHVDVEYDKTPLNDQETKTTDVEQDKRMSTLSDGKNNFEGRHAAGNNEEHAVRLERELASLRADLDRTVKKQEEDSSNRDKKHSNKKNKKERSPKKKSSTTSTSSASEEVVRNLPNTTSTTSSFASGASSPSKKKDFLYYREKFSDVPLANQIELNREQGRRFWGDKIRDLESQIEEKNRLLLRAVQTPNMISVRGGPPLNEDPAAGLTTGGEVRATDINKIVAKNVREVMDSNLREFLHEELHQKRVRDLQEVTAGLKKLETEETCTKVRGMLNELMELRKRPEFGSYYRNSGRDGNINSFGFELPNEKQMHEMHKKFVQEFASRGSFNPLLEKEARAGLDDLDGNDQHPEGPGMGGGGMLRIALETFHL
ncbi:unnamed protein product [Amoebophrya sp. A25]|nr:unnamed protein product [Amoebophrya sp. A25]|eukprot:GSA25T00025410001.1